MKKNEMYYWRSLREGEKILEGDEFFSSINKKWLPCSTIIGRSYSGLTTSNSIRRKVNFKTDKKKKIMG